MPEKYTSQEKGAYNMPEKANEAVVEMKKFMEDMPKEAQHGLLSPQPTKEETKRKTVTIGILIHSQN